MFHEEKVIDGVLHWRDTPDGKWIAFDARQLTALLEATRGWIDGAMAELTKLKAQS